MGIINEQPLYSITVGQYKEILRNSIKEELQKHNKECDNRIPELNSNPDIVFIDMACEITGYTKSPIYSKVSRFEIPVLGRGRPLAFSRKMLEKWITDGRPSVIDQESYEYLNSRKS